MTDPPLTLSLLAGLEADGSKYALSAEERANLVVALRLRAQEIRKLAPYDLGERLFGAVATSLRKPLANVLTEVWKQRKEMRDVAAKGDDSRDVEADVELFDHEITWAVHPTVKIQLNGADVGTLRFDVEIGLELEGLRLVIKNACITKVTSGKLSSTVDFKYKGFPLMAPRRNSVDLP